jgi:hypothetical protein
MEEQYRQVIRQKIVDALAALKLPVSARKADSRSISTPAMLMAEKN